MTISNKIRTIAVESLDKVHDVDAKIKSLKVSAIFGTRAAMRRR